MTARLEPPSMQSLRRWGDERLRRILAEGLPFPRRGFLRSAVVVLCLLAALFAAAVYVAVGDNQDAVTSVGEEGAAGIRAAQRIKSDLAELDLVVTDTLLSRAAPVDGLPVAYNVKHKELVEKLVDAGQRISLGQAETLPLRNLLYEVPLYQSLVRGAVEALRQGDRAGALELQKRAHEAMVGPLGLQDQAGAFDKANTYALNQSYERHKDNSSRTLRFLVITGLLLVLALVIVQVVHAFSFRRLLNVGLAASTVVAVIVLLIAVANIGGSSDDLAEARERTFDRVHELGQARAAVFAARQAQAQWLVDPSGVSTWQASFDASVAALFRLPDGATGDALATRAQSADVPPGAGGYLVNALVAQPTSDAAGQASTTMLARLGDFITSDTQLRALANRGRDAAVAFYAAAPPGGESAQRFEALVASIDDGLRLHEGVFEDRVESAGANLPGVEVAGFLGAAAIAMLVSGGLWLRLREYGAA